MADATHANAVVPNAVDIIFSDDVLDKFFGMFVPVVAGVARSIKLRPCVAKLYRFACFVIAEPVGKLPEYLFLYSTKIDTAYYFDPGAVAGICDVSQDVVLTHERVNVGGGQWVLEEIDDATGVYHQGVAVSFEHIVHHCLRIVVGGIRLPEYRLKHSKGLLVPHGLISQGAFC